MILLLISLLSSAQTMRYPSDILAYVRQLEASEPKSLFSNVIDRYDSLGNKQSIFSYTYYAGPDKKLSKAVINEDNISRTYYFSNETLVEVKSINGHGDNRVTTTSFFTEMIYSIGTTYRDYYNDRVILEKEKLLADAYKILLHFKRLSQ